MSEPLDKMLQDEDHSIVEGAKDKSDHILSDILPEKLGIELAVALEIPESDEDAIGVVIPELSYMEQGSLFSAIDNVGQITTTVAMLADIAINDYCVHTSSIGFMSIAEARMFMDNTYEGKWEVIKVEI